MLKFNEEFIKIDDDDDDDDDDDGDKGYILEVNVKYPKNLHDL